MHIHRHLSTVLALLSLAAPALAGDGDVVPAQNAPAQNPPPQNPPPQNAPPQTPPPQTAPPQTAPPAEAPAAQEPPQKKMIKAQFKVLRFQENWSFLEDPNNTTDLWFPQTKWIELAEGWHLDVGGQFRYRYENQENKNLQGTFPGHNDFTLLREQVYADLHIEDDARFFVQFINSGIHGNTSSDPPPTATDRDNWDFLDLFADLIAPDFFLRVGRFQMAYGKERVIGVGDWANTPRSFQGGLVEIHSPDFVSDIFFTHPVIIEPRSADEINASRHFSGAYNTWKLNDTDVLDGYLLALNDDDDVVVSGNGSPGGLNVYTLGTRYAGKSAPFDWDGEVAVQGGNSSNDTIRAWMWSIASGYTMSDLPGVPRVGLDVDVASGDSDPTDGGKGTYNQLFPSSHPFFGYMDLVGRQNIISVIPNVRWQLGDTAWFRAAWCDFNLQNRHDSLYNAQGVATLTDNSGNSGNHVGQEWDFTLGIKPSFLAPHSEFLFGYSYFSPGNFVDNTGGGSRPQLAYMQYTFTF